MKAIVLTRGRIATVDDEDFDRCNQFKWYASKKKGLYYGRRNVRRSNGKRGTQYLHEFILGVKGVDHRDGDGLNDRRKNLRRATQLQNCRSFKRKRLGATSQYRGVCWNVGANRWSAQIRVAGRQTYLGLFEVELDAARAYDDAARKFFKGFATPNFL